MIMQFCTPLNVKFPTLVSTKTNNSTVDKIIVLSFEKFIDDQYYNLTIEFLEKNNDVLQQTFNHNDFLMNSINWKINGHLANDTIRCKNFATVVSGRKNVTMSFVRQKQMRQECRQIAATCCYFQALVFTCFRLTKSYDTFFPIQNNCFEVLESVGVIQQSCYYTSKRTLVFL